MQTSGSGHASRASNELTVRPGRVRHRIGRGQRRDRHGRRGGRGHRTRVGQSGPAAPHSGDFAGARCLLGRVLHRIRRAQRRDSHGRRRRTRVGESSAAAPHRGDGDTVLAPVRRHHPRPVRLLAVGRRARRGRSRCCPAVLDRRSGVLQCRAYRGQRARQQPNRQERPFRTRLPIPQVAADSSSPLPLPAVQGSTGTMPHRKGPNVVTQGKKTVG